MKVVGCVIACNEEEFLSASVESIAPVTDEFVFVIGGNRFACEAGMCNEDGLPTDDTLAIAYDLAEKYNGTVIEPPNRLWRDKIEMRNAYVPFLKSEDWLFVLDGDEVYKEEQLLMVSELMKHNDILIMQFWLFWNNVNTVGTGSWGHYPQERIIKWKEGYGYNNSHVQVSYPNGRLVDDTVPTYRGEEKLFYHYSWVRPTEKIRQKILYYKYQNGTTNDGYVDGVFLKWRTNPEEVQGKTHPMGGGESEAFKGTHPEMVQRLIKEGKLDFG